MPGGKRKKRKGPRPAGAPLTERAGFFSRTRTRIVGAAGILAVVAIAIPAFLLLSGDGGKDAPPRAAIVDQLSVREPDPAFVENVTALLEDAGYIVDYVPGEQATVDLYRSLPGGGYDLILLRAHSAIPSKDLTLPPDLTQEERDTIMAKIGDDVLLFTSERYDSNSYRREQQEWKLFPVVYTGDPDSEQYLAISSRFVDAEMEGRFDGTTFFLMGCSSLASSKTAKAFVDKGAKAVAGWSGTVTPQHTDAATERALRHMLVDGQPFKEAVEATMADLGNDPHFDSRLLSYP